jgi:hypothetical protein
MGALVDQIYITIIGFMLVRMIMIKFKKDDYEK